MKLSDKVEELFVITLLLVAIILVAGVVGAKGEEDEPLEIVGWVRCSTISNKCINFIFPNKFMCEAGMPPLYDCFPTNFKEE